MGVCGWETDWARWQLAQADPTGFDCASADPLAIQNKAADSKLRMRNRRRLTFRSIEALQALKPGILFAS